MMLMTTPRPYNSQCAVHCVQHNVTKIEAITTATTAFDRSLPAIMLYSVLALLILMVLRVEFLRRLIVDGCYYLIKIPAKLNMYAETNLAGRIGHKDKGRIDTATMTAETVKRCDQATQTQEQDQGDHIEVIIQNPPKNIIMTLQGKTTSADSRQETEGRQARKSATDAMNLRWNLQQLWDNDLICPVCLNFFTSPVVLSCMHSYCRTCVQALVRMAGKKIIPCPICRKTTYIISIDRLPKNWYLEEVNEKVGLMLAEIF